MIELKKDGKVRAKIWADFVEDSALKQIEYAMGHPRLFKHVAVMPDVHAGMGVPIGCVIALKDAVIPQAIGVDISCLDKDTEFLSPKGWRKISEWDGEDILQYDKHTDIASFVTPQNYIVKDCEYFYHFKTKYGIDQMLSPDHKMIVWKGYKKRGYNITDYTVTDFVKKHKSLKKGIQGGSKTVFDYKTSSALKLTDTEIRVQIMVAADGCLRKPTTTNTVEMHFKKPRKIKRCKYLLNLAGIPFTEKITEATYIEFQPPIWSKSLTMFWKASKKQLNILAEECLLWDGHKGNHEFFSTTNEESAKIVQFAFAVSGVRAGIHKRSFENPKWKAVHFVYKTKNTITGFRSGCIKKTPSVDGKSFCFTVPSGYFVARRNGKIFITGNCGVILAQTNVDYKTFEPHFQEIYDQIKRSVPMGFHHRTDEQYDRIAQWIPPDIMDSIQEYQRSEWGNKSIKHQVGTLGSGNHMIEFQKDPYGGLCVMVHSGSRNIGNRIASTYIKIAEKESNYPGLDYLDTNSDEGKEYLKHYEFARTFASLNRYVMMKELMQILRVCVPSILDTRCMTEEASILFTNVSHNYVELENHFGEDVWVHRKGAIKAGSYQNGDFSDIGLIPGSMGTASYIVHGKGNKESFSSCSHGAGRTMSRTAARGKLDNKARRQGRIEYKSEGKLSVEDFETDMEHVFSNNIDRDHLDESPRAYKDIEKVMENQKDLVEISEKLIPVFNMKG